jgi:tetraacyldisaccharide 4'-kinase
MRAPEFWQAGAGGLSSALLTPAAWLYAAGASLRRACTAPWRAPVPVICVGNLVAGGAGKTPIALDLGTRLVEGAMAAHFLTRGYGGKISGPHRVDPEHDQAADVGDEPLLLARAAPTWVARDRAAGARAACAAGASAIVMDDGFQNPGLIQDLSFLVVDGAYGFGNGRLLPAGPLRESTAAGLGRASALVMLGDDETGLLAQIANMPKPPPVLRARAVAGPEAMVLAGEPMVAFAGIGRPEKFFDTLRNLGCPLKGSKAFADHHPYTLAELDELRAQAKALDAQLLTTTKDWIRIPPAWRSGIVALTIVIEWQDESALYDLLEPFREGPEQ